MPHVGVIFLMIDVCIVLKIIDIVKANLTSSLESCMGLTDEKLTLTSYRSSDLTTIFKCSDLITTHVNQLNV